LLRALSQMFRWMFRSPREGHLKDPEEALGAVQSTNETSSSAHLASALSAENETPSKRKKETTMQLTVIGSGDAFGSGGRLQTSFHVRDGDAAFLIDCGASTLIGMHRENLDPNGVETIFISHLHGDHFAGLVWWKIHAHHTVRRDQKLTLVGPKGLEKRLFDACEALFPGSGELPPRFELEFVEFEAEQPIEVNGTKLTAFRGEHPSGGLSASLRLERNGKIVSYSGDTQWVDSLIECATGADLFITECYSYDQVHVPYHLNWRILSEKIELLGAHQVMVTHMNNNMLANRDKIGRDDILLASDGLVVDI
jgi:ribonuclease BN (tRNA processing enzyme)